MFRTLTQFKIWRKLLLGILIGLGCSFTACEKAKQKALLGFYHWKTTVDISLAEQCYLKDLGSQRLYLRFFDVLWSSEGPSFSPALRLKRPLPAELEIVPVVFITNRCILNSSDAQLQDLAKKLTLKIQDLQEQNNWSSKEVQIDCDWSPKSRQRYFDLLQAIKAQSGWQLSATIRLHQVKYAQKTGTPPVDRGVLMFYNMGDLRDIETKNSILDIAIAKKYLYNFEEYKLPLDIALPLFSWAVQIRFREPVQLLEGVRVSDLSDSSIYLEQDDSHFLVKKGHYLKGRYVYKGDVLRVEEVPYAKLKEAARLLATELPTSDNMEVLFYHLDSNIIKHYHHEELRRLVEYFD